MCVDNGNEQEQIKWIPFPPPPTAISVDGDGSVQEEEQNASNGGAEMEVLTDGEAASSSSDSDEAEHAIDHLFAELMTEDMPAGQEEERAAVTEGRKSADRELIMFLDGVDGVQATATITVSGELAI